MDLERCEVRRGTVVEPLTPLEVTLLGYLAERAGRAVSREEVLAEVWGYHPNSRSQAVAVAIRRLRHKIEEDPTRPSVLRTVRGIGWRLAEPGQPDEADADAPAPPRTNLRPSLDPFFGRSAEMARLARPRRLTTLLGPAGIGKTRLAREAAWRLLATGQAAQAWFVDLSTARSAPDVVALAHAALGIPIPDGTPAEQAAHLGGRLARKGPVCLVWDNLEQVVEVSGEVLTRVLATAPEVTLLATSRARLRVPGERVLPVGPLAPDDAYALFCDRAAAMVGAFEPSPDEAGILRRLLDGLDHIPLAIELAAARSGLFTIARLERMLSDRFALLQVDRGKPERHATLQAALDWSWDLLSEAEQRALAWLSVFVGGFTLEAAVAVLGEDDAGETVSALLDKSLLVRVDPAWAEDDFRFDQLASVRDYARSKLDPGGAAAARTRHLRHFADLGTPGRLEGGGEAGVRGRRALRSDLGNLVAAAEFGMAQGEADLAAQAGFGALLAIRGVGPYAPIVALSDRILEDAGVSARWRVSVLRIQGAVLELSGLPGPAADAYREAHTLGAEIGLEYERLRALNGLALVQRRRGEPSEARRTLDEVLQGARTCGDQYLEALALSNLGTIDEDQGDLESATAWYNEALALQRELADVRGEAFLLGYLGNVANATGRPEEALALHERALHLHERLGSRGMQGVAQLNMMAALRVAGRLEEARRIGERAVEVLREAGDPTGECAALGNLGGVKRDQGDLRGARADLAMAVALAHEVEWTGGEGTFRGALGEVLVGLGERERGLAEFACGEALLRAESRRLELAELLCGRARVLAACGDGDGARAALGGAEELAAAIQAPPESELQRHLQEVRAALGG